MLKINFKSVLFILFGIFLFSSAIYLLNLNSITALFQKIYLKFENILIANVKWSRTLRYGALMLSCWCIEFIVIGWEKSSFREIFVKRSQTAVSDAINYFLVIFRFVDYIAVLFSFGLSKLVPNWINSYSGYNLINSIDSEILKNIIFVLILDFWLYWNHRLSHSIKAYWELHKYHHSATEMTMLTTSRIHPVEHAITTTFLAFPIFLVGVPIETFFIFGFFTNWLGHIHHSTLPWNWGFVGKYIFVSPANHRIHHSTNKMHYDKNFGSVTPLWDHIFGTYCGDDTHVEFGIEDNYFNKKGIIYDYIVCYISFFKTFFSYFNFKTKYGR